jgi:hypothetical protein
VSWSLREGCYGALRGKLMLGLEGVRGGRRTRRCLGWGFSDRNQRIDTPLAGKMSF